MPPKAKVTKEMLIQGAMELLARVPEEKFHARLLADSMGISTQPIFSNFRSMNELKEEVIQKLMEQYEALCREEEASGKWPVYKASGMAYVRFARERPALFRLLFMRERKNEATPSELESFNKATARVAEATALSPEKASLLHLEMWTCVHGIATMTATGYLELEEAAVSLILTDIYQALLGQQSKEKEA